MSAGITVEDFKYVRGVNDSEYIKLLEKHLDNQRYITSKAIAKIKGQPKIVRCVDCRFAEKRGCAIYCRAWNRYTAHKGFCHQGDDKTREEGERLCGLD